jgi:hypothetical protein
MFNCTQFKRVMDQSGLTKRELGKLLVVSRQTLYTWRDKAPAQPLIAERAEKYTTGLIAAMDKGLLPLPATLSPEQRVARLAQMAKALHKLTEPK